ncbi:hypothetical protein [Flavobacterium sp. ENC]|uniref:hypothetical protein n=1 Tax=Flavobacterium sp. ENC TaxID=2897330 RepID=UPI001E5019EA|nr:hypothetical protein [Flavobacterium sp. ENC]MCD0467382.1 hypothetical protein [Flavobacterium sp. ENC]
MKNPFFKYVILSILSILIAEIFKKAIHYDNSLYNSLCEQLTSLQIKNLTGFQKRWQWIEYMFIPAILLIKTILIAAILYIGLTFSDRELKFNRLWDAVIKAEFIFLLVPVFKIIWFYFFQTSYTLKDIQNFYPLSALSIIEYTELQRWSIYPFQILNLFELTYIIYLGYQVGQLTNTHTGKGLKIVGYSYVHVLLLWVVTIMFFTKNYS